MPSRPDDSAQHAHLEKIRGLRNRPKTDYSLGFMTDEFQREVARPFKQLEGLAELWCELLPAEVAAGTRLEALKRGVLTVAVDSSARLYEVDRRLRGGLETELVTRHKGPAFRKVKLRVDGSGWGAEG